MLAIYVSQNQFIVYGNKTSDFAAGRRLKLDNGVDGVAYTSVQSSSYTDPSTTVSINSNSVTTNLSSVLYGIINTGEEGSLPAHNHTNSNGNGGLISFNSLLDTENISTVASFTDLDDTPNSYVSDKYLKTTASGISFVDGTHTFLDLVDTPSSYIDKYILKCTASGVVFDTFPEWHVAWNEPTYDIGKRLDYYVDSLSGDIWRKDPGWVEDSGTLLRDFDLGPSNLSSMGFTTWGSPVNNGTYYSFPPAVSAALYYNNGSLIDESSCDIKVRFRIYSRNENRVQIIAGFGDSTNGIAIGVDASNNIGIFGRASGVQTRITIPSAQYKNYTWYSIYASAGRLILHEEGTTNVIDKSGSCVATNCTTSQGAYFGYSPSGLNSAIDGTNGQFSGDIDYVRVYSTGDLDFPDFSVSNAAWVKVGSMSFTHQMNFTQLYDTPKTYTNGNYLRMTASGIQSVDGIILSASDNSEWVLKVTSSGVLYTEAA